MQELTILEAYKAMICFLDDFYNKTNSYDIGSLLGSMELCSDGKTMDIALWDDWIKSVNLVKNINGNVKKLTIFEAYDAVINFLKIYIDCTISEDAKKLTEKMSVIRKKEVVYSEIWNVWIKSVNLVENN